MTMSMEVYPRVVPLCQPDRFEGDKRLQGARCTAAGRSVKGGSIENHVHQQGPFASDIRAYWQEDESTCLNIFDRHRPKYFTGPERAIFASNGKMHDPILLTFY